MLGLFRPLRKLPVVTAVLMLAALFGLSRYLRSPQDHAVERGYRLAAELGCFACHGVGGVGGIANPGSIEGVMPGWDGGMLMMYVESEEEIREWILYGLPQRLRNRAPDPRNLALIRMPAYEKSVSPRELSDLVEYVKAVGYFERPESAQVRRGRQLASRLGCFGCHKAGGTLGSANPGSFKGYIPPWVGPDFAELVRDEDELREWILEGGIDRLQRNPVSRYFTGRQIIQMPAYREHIDPGELEDIIAYIWWLRREGSD